MKTRFLFASAIALSITAGGAVGQTTMGQPANPPAGTNDPQGTNTSRDAYGNALPPQNKPAPTITPFEMLDRDKAGALKMDQARGDPWLSQHFVECDVNHNDEVTRSEYEACTTRR
jgi:hypothetical protein